MGGESSLRNQKWLVVVLSAALVHWERGDFAYMNGSCSQNW